MTRLFSTASVEEQWRLVAGPWLREQAATAWTNTKPTVVLTPSRAESFYLRSRLVEEGISFLGLRFWTPSDTRKFLQKEMASGIGMATQAELRLVARVCAEKLLHQGTHPSALTSVVQEPGPFLRAYDLLLGTGWDPAREGPFYGRALAGEMKRILEEFHLATQAGLHRHLRHEAVSQKKPKIASLLMIGFNAAHWPLWDLLKATVFWAEQAVVALIAPREFGQEIDQLWHGSWEEVLEMGAEIPEGPMDESEESPFAELIASYEKGEPGADMRNEGKMNDSDLTFLVTPELTSQVEAVVLRALDYLQGDSCTRLGIVFPETNALALGVAEQLQRLGIPLDDGTGSVAPGIFERRSWQTWIALQEEPSVQRLIAWLRACEVEGVLCKMDNAEKLSARDVAHVLENALGESLVDDLNFLARYLEENPARRHANAVAAFLRERIQLPGAASFAELLEVTRQAASISGWESYSAQLQIGPPAWLQEMDEPISRRTFLEWLKETTDSRTRIRGAEGNHFYGKVHLLIYAQMTGQTWSHLILTGLNEGVWPRVYEMGAFGSRHEWAALNRQARALNRHGTTQGRQGEGHEAVRADCGHCLLPLERRDLALRDLVAALEGTRVAVCLTAMTTEAGRSLLPSDFFNHACQARTGRPLDETAFRHLATVTSEWCGRHKNLFQSEAGVARPAPITATRIAYEARRNLTQPFGPYEFAFREPPARPIQLSCKTWEEAWNHPSFAWLEQVVGASPWPEGTLSWPRAIGTWVHRWLATALRECQERDSTGEFPVLLWAAADREIFTAHARAKSVGIELYPWWNHVWTRARNLALGLGETLAPLLRNTQFLVEFQLPPNLMTALPGTEQKDFSLKGRIDLLLIEARNTQPEPNQGDADFLGHPCWVIDFKTGAAQNLNEKKIAKGIGLQPLLYALAVRVMGAGPTAISLHTFDASLKQQVELDNIIEVTPLFRSLDKLHRAGIFGMRGDSDNEYGYSPAYPLATRSVPGSVLEAKWALIHGANPAKEEEEA